MLLTSPNSSTFKGTQSREIFWTKKDKFYCKTIAVVEDWRVGSWQLIQVPYLATLTNFERRRVQNTETENVRYKDNGLKMLKDCLDSNKSFSCSMCRCHPQTDKFMSNKKQIGLNVTTSVAIRIDVFRCLSFLSCWGFNGDEFKILKIFSNGNVCSKNSNFKRKICSLKSLDASPEQKTSNEIS